MSYSSEVLADSPLAYYRLNDTTGTAADASGNSRDMAYTGSPTQSVTGALLGDSDKAVTFNGSTQYASIAAASWMNTTSAFTIEAWVKTTATSGTIFGRGANPANYRIGVTSGKAFVEMNSTGGTTLLSGATSVNDGNWHHIVGTWTGGTLTIYVDGVSDGSVGKSGPLTTTANPLRIAQRNSDSFLAGTVDECAIYNTNIGPTRIAAHYTAGTTAPPGSASGSASLSLSGSGAVTAPMGGAGALALSGAGAAAAPVVGSGALSLSASGGTGSTSTASASLALAAMGAPAAPVLAAASLTLAASGAADATAAGSGALIQLGAGGAGGDTGGTATLELTGAGDAVGSVDASGTGSLTLSAIETTYADGGASLELSATGEAAPLYRTDTSNSSNGRTRGGAATVTVVRPAAPLPPGRTFGKRYDKALAYPTPDMVDGRPT